MWRALQHRADSVEACSFPCLSGQASCCISHVWSAPNAAPAACGMPPPLHSPPLPLPAAAGAPRWHRGQWQAAGTGGACREGGSGCGGREGQGTDARLCGPPAAAGAAEAGCTAFLGACPASTELHPPHLSSLCPALHPGSQTSNPDVYAVGDIAAFPLLLSGKVVRQEHVVNSRWGGRDHALHAVHAPPAGAPPLLWKAACPLPACPVVCPLAVRRPCSLES